MDILFHPPGPLQCKHCLGNIVVGLPILLVNGVLGQNESILDAACCLWKSPCMRVCILNQNHQQLVHSLNHSQSDVRRHSTYGRDVYSIVSWEKKFLEVQMKAANLTAAHGEFLLMEAGISAELRDTVRRVTHFTTQEVTQLLTEMMSSQFLSATRNNLQTAFNAKHVSTCSPTGKMMLGFQYLFLCVSTHLYGSVQLLFVFCKPRNSFSSSSHRLNWAEGSIRTSFRWCMQRESGGRAILNGYGRAILNDKVLMSR